MNNELERIWKEAVTALLKVHSHMSVFKDGDVK
jgi:hypothetical protein